MYDTVSLMRTGPYWKVITSNSEESYGTVYLYDTLDVAMCKVRDASEMMKDEKMASDQRF